MEEEFCSDGQLLVAVNGDGNVCGIQRLGSSAVEPEMMTEMLEVHFYLHTQSLVGIWQNATLFILKFSTYQLCLRWLLTLVCR
jgi:hypothetical protein